MDENINESSAAPLKYIRAPIISDNNLHPSTGSLIMRLLFGVLFHHLPSDIIIQKSPYCKLHIWSGVKQCRKKIIECSTCNITLCHTCYNVFHTSHDICASKNDLKKCLGFIDDSQIGDNNDDTNISISVSGAIVGL